MRKVFDILDIETVTDARLAFDIAWIVCDSKGNILERYNALVSEVVNSPFGMAFLRRDSFIKNKSQMYIDAINFNGIDIKSFADIMQDFNNISTRYNAKTVMCAYNAKFDYSVLNDNASYIYGYGEQFFNDNVEIARAINADGVHVGQNDMEAINARSILGNDKIIGVSVQTAEQAIIAEKQGADYLGVGAVFPTGSKTDAEDVSYETLKEICETVSIPVVAIGGINASNVLTLKGSGIAGIAVISAIFGADDIEYATKNLKKLTAKVVAK